MRIAIVLTMCLLTGCSANYWGGEDSGRTPGLHVRGRTLFTPAEVALTSNGDSEVTGIEYTGATETQPATFKAAKITLNQDVSTVLKEQPEKIRAIGEMQMSQVAYLKEMMTGIKGIVSEIVPVFNLLAAAKIRSTEEGMTLTLPGGFSLGKTKITRPEDMSAYLKSTAQALEAVTATTQPAQ